MLPIDLETRADVVILPSKAGGEAALCPAGVSAWRARSAMSLRSCPRVSGPGRWYAPRWRRCSSTRSRHSTIGPSSPKPPRREGRQTTAGRMEQRWGDHDDPPHGRTGPLRESEMFDKNALERTSHACEIELRLTPACRRPGMRLLRPSSMRVVEPLGGHHPRSTVVTVKGCCEAQVLAQGSAVRMPAGPPFVLIVPAFSSFAPSKRNAAISFSIMH